jgi:hypothetical protein
MIKKLFLDALGIRGNYNERSFDTNIPSSLRLLLEVDAQLSESILCTDVRILQPDQFYDASGYTVFAEESQCVVMWGFKSHKDDAKCFQIVNNNPLEVYEEDGSLGSVVIGMTVANLLSSGLFKYWHSAELSLDGMQRLLKSGITDCGVLSNVRSYIYKSVVFNLEVDQKVRLDAASQSNDHMNAFKKIVEKCVG